MDSGLDMDLISIGENLGFFCGLGMMFYQWMRDIDPPKQKNQVQKIDLTGLRPEVVQVIVQEVNDALAQRGKVTFKVINLELVRDDQGAIITTLAWDALTSRFLYQAKTKDDVADYLNKTYPDHLFIVNDDDFNPHS
jgi:uncharacterized protein YozE (UPF0346 family)